ncbi:MAG TPA: exonuclease SbcCD subunit D [Gemmatimonadales bacterium]|nr:exonuclease SbcCD subunit D [Gemmatimonadales bacterium]
MKIAHLADLHLGFRQYHRQTPAGINQREADVANAFRAAVDGVLAARPDAVIMAGDLFHAVRPTNFSIVFAFRQLQRLREGLPAAPIVLIAGNHDTPRSSDTGSILRLYEELGVHVAADRARRFPFKDLDLSVLAVPWPEMVGPEKLNLRPDGGETYQVLALHGATVGLYPEERAGVDFVGNLLDPDLFTREPWNYVALGHYHVQHQVRPKVWYAGALDYVTSNPWGELQDETRLLVGGKGWLLADLESGDVRRMPVAPARPVHDLPWLNAGGMSPAEVDRAIGDLLAAIPGGLADSITRLVVTEIPRHVVRELDHAAIRAAKASALHLHLDFRRPESVRAIGVGAPWKRMTLPETVADFLTRRPLPERVPRDRFVALGLELLAEPDDPSAAGSA